MSWVVRHGHEDNLDGALVNKDAVYKTYQEALKWAREYANAQRLPEGQYFDPEKPFHADGRPIRDFVFYTYAPNYARCTRTGWWLQVEAYSPPRMQ